MLGSSYDFAAPFVEAQPAAIGAPPHAPAAPADREHALVLNNIRLAEAIARRYSSVSSDPRDIRQVAMLGLVKAAKRFDPSRGFEFAAFASPTIAGEIKRYLRDTAWLVRPPRSVQELSLTAAAAVPELEQAFGREPTPAEIAQDLSRSIGEVAHALAARHAMFATPLENAADHISGSLAGEADPFDAIERDVELHRAVQMLPARDRRLLYMRFFEGHNQREIAAELGMSQMQVSRSLSKALRTLKTLLEATLDESNLERSA